MAIRLVSEEIFPKMFIFLTMDSSKKFILNFFKFENI